MDENLTSMSDTHSYDGVQIQNNLSKKYKYISTRLDYVPIKTESVRFLPGFQDSISKCHDFFDLNPVNEMFLMKEKGILPESAFPAASN